MKKVTAVLIVYAIIVIASSIFWVWYALSKPRLTAGAKLNINLAAVPDKMQQDATIVTDKATELTGGVKKDVKADGHASDMVKSIKKRGHQCNDPEHRALRSTLFLRES